jgi:hypothetical protein
MSSLESAIAGDDASHAVPSQGPGPATCTKSESQGTSAKPDEDNIISLEGLIEDHIIPKLDPEFLQYFAKHHVPAPQPNIPIEHVRANPQAFRSPCALDTSGYEGVTEDSFASTRDENVRIPVRVYYPDEARHGPGPYPVHLNFHGTSPELFE